MTGDTRGHVKFYDENFILLTWYNKFNQDAIMSISFSKESTEGYVEDYTVEAKPLIIRYQEKHCRKSSVWVLCIFCLADFFFGLCRNFVVSTASSMVAHVSPQKNVTRTLLKENCKPLQAVVCHPKQPAVAMGNHAGILKVWDYNSKVVTCERVFETEKQIQCIAFDPQGKSICQIDTEHNQCCSATIWNFTLLLPSAV